jgi:hypothetical protein
MRLISTRAARHLPWPRRSHPAGPNAWLPCMRIPVPADRAPRVEEGFRSLESTIKIISDEMQLTKGKEKGAHNYIDNLRGAKLIEVWEI